MPQLRHHRHRGRALYVVAATFFLLAAYIAFAAGSALLEREEPDHSAVGLVLSVLSLVIMPALAWWKQRTGREMGSRGLRHAAIPPARRSCGASDRALALEAETPFLAAAPISRPAA